jgi:hypothetical protein
MVEQNALRCPRIEKLRKRIYGERGLKRQNRMNHTDPPLFYKLPPEKED